MSNYSKLKLQLDEIIQNMQSGNFDIDETIKEYKKAQTIIAKMQKHLQETKVTIKKLKKL